MKITLVCYAGMSTGLMKLKLEQEAAKAGRDDVVLTPLLLPRPKMTLVMPMSFCSVHRSATPWMS